MLNKLINLESVALLSNEQQKTVIGGRLRIRNMQASGEIMEYNGGVYACECSWEYNEGDGWHTRTGACSGDLEYSCLN